MRGAALIVPSVVLMTGLMAGAADAQHVRWEERPAYQRAGFTTVAVIANYIPIVSAFWAPKCLPGYVWCKLGFATFNTAAAGAQLVASGGADMEQTRAILYRGWAGDWYLTGRDIAGDHTANPYPDPPPPASRSEGKDVLPPPM